MKPITPFLVMEILARAKEMERAGRDIIHLEIGEPDFATPGPVIQTAIEFLGRGRVTYTPAAGIPELRTAIAEYYARRHGIEVPVSRIFVTPGASGAFLLILSMMVSDGAKVLLSDPGYPCHANLVRAFGGEAVGVPAGPETNFHLDAERLRDHWDRRCIGSILASPSNPTGTMIAAPVFERLIHTLDELGGWLISDEIYHGLEHSGKAPTALAYSSDMFVVNSFSKYFGMTGWRVGWTVVPEHLVAQAESLAQNLFISAPAPSQYAAVTAMSPACSDELEQRRDEYLQRCQRLSAGLLGLGFAIPAAAEGAFYLYADSSAFARDSHALALRILEHTGVAITPGKDFGTYRSQDFLRFCYAASTPRLSEALARLGEFLVPQQI